jgi:hypothetical protein
MLIDWLHILIRILHLPFGITALVLNLIATGWIRSILRIGNGRHFVLLCTVISNGKYDNLAVDGG